MKRISPKELKIKLENNDDIQIIDIREPMNTKMVPYVMKIFHWIK